MSKEICIRGAVFGYGDDVTGYRLKEFFRKYTGKDIDFNKIRNSKPLRLLFFSIPLYSFQEVGITAAGATPYYVKRFISLDDFISWYENEYLDKTIIDEEFIRKYKKLNIKEDIKFDPFPKMLHFCPIDFDYKNKPQATIVLANGLMSRVPFDFVRECCLVMHLNLSTDKKGIINWNKLFRYLDIKESKDYKRNISRITPDNKYISYDYLYDNDVKYICDSINYSLNKKSPFDYPYNWFEVINELKKLIGKPISINGEDLIPYLFASPRCYLHFFKKYKTPKEIADDIFCSYC